MKCYICFVSSLIEIIMIFKIYVLLQCLSKCTINTCKRSSSYCNPNYFYITFIPTFLFLLSWIRVGLWEIVYTVNLMIRALTMQCSIYWYNFNYTRWLIKSECRWCRVGFLNVIFSVLWLSSYWLILLTVL